MAKLFPQPLISKLDIPTYMLTLNYLKCRILILFSQDPERVIKILIEVIAKLFKSSLWSFASLVMVGGGLLGYLIKYNNVD